MSNQNAENRSRRAFLAGAGGFVTAQAAASYADGAQPQNSQVSQDRDRSLWVTCYDCQALDAATL